MTIDSLMEELKRNPVAVKDSVLCCQKPETISGGSVGGQEPIQCTGAPGKSCKFKKTGNTRVFR